MMNNPTFDAASLGGLPSSRLRQLSADLAIIATAFAVLGLFAISTITLEHFQIPYITSGGGFLSKFHPSTFLAVTALVLRCLATTRPLRTGRDIVVRDSNIIIFGCSIAIAALHAVAVAKTPVTPLVDTFVLPALFLFLLRDLHPAILRRLAILLALLLCANAFMALFEFFKGTHIVKLAVPDGVSSDPTRSDAIFDWRAEMMQDWRATALLGHPLVNGLLIGSFILCLLAPGSRWLDPLIKAPLLALQGVSMFAFGARVSLVLTFAFAVCFVAWQCSEAIGRGARLTSRSIALGVIGVALCAVAVAVMYQMGFFDNTIGRFASDEGSAKTRAIMFQLFQPLSWNELILGPSQEVVTTWQRIYGLEFGIESAWIGLMLSYGLVVTFFIVFGLLAFLQSVAQAGGRGSVAILFFFLVSVSGTASLSGKTTTLAMTVILVLVYLQKDERSLPIRSCLSVNTV